MTHYEKAIQIVQANLSKELKNAKKMPPDYKLLDKLNAQIQILAEVIQVASSLTLIK